MPILITAVGAFGRYRGVEPRVKVSMMIMRPPQHGHGWERVGGSVLSPILANRTAAEIEARIVEFSLEQPAFGQIRIANEMKKLEDIDHSRSKTKSPQTNGIVEHLHKTMLNEFYRVAFRKKLSASIADLQADLDEWIRGYNEARPHQGRWCFGKTPMQTFLDAIRGSGGYKLL